MKQYFKEVSRDWAIFEVSRWQIILQKYPKYLESILQTSLFKQKQQDIEQVGVALMVMV